MKKKKLTPEQLHKKWVKTLRIWRKISNRVRVSQPKPGRYSVEARDYLPIKREYTEWHELNTFGSMKHALKKKHSFIVMIMMRELGYRNEFVQRRTNRKRKKGII